MFSLNYQRLSILLHDWFVVSLVAWVGAFGCEYRFPGLISQLLPLGTLLGLVLLVGFVSLILKTLPNKT